MWFGYFFLLRFIGGGVLKVQSVWRLVPHFLSLALLSSLVMLGTWQFKRHQWKTTLIHTIHQRPQAEALDLDRATQIPAAEREFYRSTIEGKFLHEYETYLMSRSYQGQSGVYVLTPFQLRHKKIVLINRGWAPTSQIKMLHRPQGHITLTGVIRESHKKNIFQPSNVYEKRQVYTIQPPELTQHFNLNSEINFYLTQISHLTPPSSYPIPISETCHLTNNHFSYMITWYSLALSWLMIYLVFCFKKRYQALS